MEKDKSAARLCHVIVGQPDPRDKDAVVTKAHWVDADNGYIYENSKNRFAVLYPRTNKKCERQISRAIQLFQACNLHGSPLHKADVLWALERAILRERHRAKKRLDLVERELARISNRERNRFTTNWNTTANEVCEIVFLASNPLGKDRLALDREVREIESMIRLAERRDRLKLISKWAVRPDDLLQVLNQHNATVLHFSGHGTSFDELVFTGSDNEPKPVSEPGLRALFKTLGGKTRLVILNACFSSSQAEAIVQFVDCTIGMNKKIGDAAAISFAAALYRAIGFGRSVQEAFDQGKTALLLKGIPEENTPELFCKNEVDASKVFLVESK